MKPERRDHQRVKAGNVQANVSSLNASKSEVPLNGEILDISRTGIRIKLSEPLGQNINDNLKITMVSPVSGVPFTVHGTLKALHSDTEFGLHYTQNEDGSVDDMLFECVKLTDSTLLIKAL